MSKILPESKFPFTRKQVLDFVLPKLASPPAEFKALKDRAASLTEKEINFFFDMTGREILAFLSLLSPDLFQNVNSYQLAAVFIAKGLARELFTMMVNEMEAKGSIQ